MKTLTLLVMFGFGSLSFAKIAEKKELKVDFNSKIESVQLDQIQIESEMSQHYDHPEIADLPLEVQRDRQSVIDFVDMEISFGKEDKRQAGRIVDRRFDSIDGPQPVAITDSVEQ